MAASDPMEYRRAQMVEALRRGGVASDAVLEAMAQVPRHLFVPAALRHQAYAPDVSISIGDGQTISQPRVVAMMTEAARVGSADRVLEVGTGSGYQAAVLARLARFVFSVERIPALARTAKDRLDRLGVANVSIKVMDGTIGWRAQAPFDAILVTAGAPEVPPSLVDQLTEGGRLVVPVGGRDQQSLVVVVRRRGRPVTTTLGDASFVPLVGREGWDGGGAS